MVNNRNIVSSIDDIYKSRIENNVDWASYRTGWGGFKAGYYDTKTKELIDNQTNELNRDGLNIKRGEIKIGDWKLYQEGSDLVVQREGKGKYYFAQDFNDNRWVNWTKK